MKTVNLLAATFQMIEEQDTWNAASQEVAETVHRRWRTTCNTIVLCSTGMHTETSLHFPTSARCLLWMEFVEQGKCTTHAALYPEAKFTFGEYGYIDPTCQAWPTVYE